jgi:hypothetical protein
MPLEAWRNLQGLSPREETALGRHAFLIPPVADVKGRSWHARDGATIADRPRQLRRTSAPSRRARRVQMGRSAFLKLIGCWATGLLGLLALALAIRFLG